MAHQGPTGNQGGQGGQRPKNAALTRSVILKALEEENIGRACNADIRKWAIGGNWPGWPTCTDAQIEGMVAKSLHWLVKHKYIVKHEPRKPQEMVCTYTLKEASKAANLPE